VLSHGEVDLRGTGAVDQHAGREPARQSAAGADDEQSGARAVLDEERRGARGVDLADARHGGEHALFAEVELEELEALRGFRLRDRAIAKPAELLGERAQDPEATVRLGAHAKLG
jgi:hypothetical protein